MIKSFITSFKLKNTYRVNSIIYSIKQLPLIKKILPNTLYEEEIKIEDKTAINELKKIINQAKEYTPTSEDAMGFDVAPSITFYLKDKTQISAVAIDDCSVSSGKKMNVVIVRNNNDDNSKKVYTVKQPLGQKIRELYEKFK